jgi:hypothetical protein
MFVDDKQFEKEANKVFWGLVVAFTAVSGIVLYLGSLA